MEFCNSKMFNNSIFYSIRPCPVNKLDPTLNTIIYSLNGPCSVFLAII